MSCTHARAAHLKVSEFSLKTRVHKVLAPTLRIFTYTTLWVIFFVRNYLIMSTLGKHVPVKINKLATKVVKILFYVWVQDHLQIDANCHDIS